MYCGGSGLRVRVPSQIRSAQPAGEHRIDCRFYSRGVRFTVETVAQHHRDRQEHRHRVSFAGSRDVGRRAMDGLEHAWSVAADAGAREHSDRAGDHRGFIAEDVAEEVLGEDHVEVAGR